MAEKFRIVKRLEQLAKQENLWVQYSALAVKHKALNMGQGFPDYPPPKHVTDALASVAAGANSMLHQYTRGYGHPRLVNALSKLYTSELQQQIDPNTNILISNGAYVSLHSVISSMIEEGDEVIILEPFFDCYEPMVLAAGGKPVFVPMRPAATEQQQQQQQLLRSSNDWQWDEQELRSAFTARSKLLIINTPNNPTGKVFSLSELETLASLCQQYNVLCISDEVYEHIVYPGYAHTRIATLPGMWQRTLTIGSAGKTFSVTGWKLGWAIGPQFIIDCMRVLHQNSCYTCPTPTQEAVAIAMETELERRNSPDCYFRSLATELLPKRDRVAELLTGQGIPVYMPAGGYFMLADVSNLPEVKNDSNSDNSNSDQCRDERLVKWLTVQHKLATIPCSCFYSRQHRQLGERFIRFCFIKQDSTIQAFGDCLKRWLAN